MARVISQSHKQSAAAVLLLTSYSYESITHTYLAFLFFICIMTTDKSIHEHQSLTQVSSIATALV